MWNCERQFDKNTNKNVSSITTGSTNSRERSRYENFKLRLCIIFVFFLIAYLRIFMRKIWKYIFFKTWVKTNYGVWIILAVVIELFLSLRNWKELNNRKEMILVITLAMYNRFEQPSNHRLLSSSTFLMHWKNHDEIRLINNFRQTWHDIKYQTDCVLVMYTNSAIKV